MLKVTCMQWAEEQSSWWDPGNVLLRVSWILVRVFYGQLWHVKHTFGCSIKHPKDSFSRGKFKSMQHLPSTVGNGMHLTCSSHGRLGRIQETEWVDRVLDSEPDAHLFSAISLASLVSLNSLASQGSAKSVLRALLGLTSYVWPRLWVL